jgi:hypothetical protein
MGRSEGANVRLIIGILFGFLLTVAGAYLHDAGADAASGRLVNWDVADRTFRDARFSAERGWNRLTGQRDEAPIDQRERL